MSGYSEGFPAAQASSAHMSGNTLQTLQHQKTRSNRLSSTPFGVCSVFFKINGTEGLFFTIIVGLWGGVPGCPGEVPNEPEPTSIERALV